MSIINRERSLRPFTSILILILGCLCHYLISKMTAPASDAPLADGTIEVRLKTTQASPVFPSPAASPNRRK
jgi:hypothetical protein